MILPVFISGYYLHCLVVEEDPFKVVSSFVYKFPYVSNFSDSFITQNKLIDAISDITKLKKINRDNLLVVSNSKQINNIDSDMILSEITSQAPILMCFLGQYGQSDQSGLDNDEVNHLFTQIYLREDLDEKVKLKIDTYKIKEFLNANIKNLKSVDQIVVCNDFASDSYKQKIKGAFIFELASIIESPSAWGITFDYDYELILKLAYLINKQINLKDYISKSHELPDIKVLFAPNATDAEFSIVKSDSKTHSGNQSMKIKQDSINPIKVPADSFIKLKLNGSKMHFAGEFNSGKDGLIIYSKGKIK